MKGNDYQPFWRKPVGLLCGIGATKASKTKVSMLAAFMLMVLAMAVVGTVAAARETAQESGDPGLDAVVETAMRRHRVPGASVAVVKGGQIVWARGYGMADVDRNVPVSPDTLFEAASVSKPVTAWGVMKLVERGLLALDAPVEQYLTRWHLPPSDYEHSQVTIRRILSHTAGLSMDGDQGVEPGQAVPTVEEALNGAVLGMRPLHVAYPPGEDYHYSSVGYTLLELAIEEVAGEPFDVFMQREVLDPLGMVHSSFDWTPERRAQTAVGHDWYNRPLPAYRRATHAQGGLLTTASDLALFMSAAMPGPNGEPVGRGVLTPGSVAEIFTPVPFAKQAESAHVAGLGYDLISVDGAVLGARKTGDHRGYKPIIAVALDQDEAIAIMANSDRAAIGFLMNVACAWSENVGGNPMAGDCRELTMIRNIQLISAAVLALGALVYIAWIVRGIRAGRREAGWVFSWGALTRLALPLLVLAAWWLLWHTDVLFADILRTLPDTAVTVRLLVPWPTAFVWISWAVTLWLLSFAGVVFAPKVKTGG